MKSFAPRDLVGYGPTAEVIPWPNGARLAVSFVINYEEGAESCLVNGDLFSEHLLGEVVGVTPLKGQRNMSIESQYEYGSRCGFWRLYRLFTERKLPVTVYACAKALELNPNAAKAMIDAQWEIATHGLRWLDYTKVSVETEREHIRKCVEIHRRITGSRPVGFYHGKPSENTRRLVIEEGGFLYDNDDYADDVPYWDKNYEKPLLIIPYALDTNDMKFSSYQGFNTGDQFEKYLTDAFDYLYEEASHPTSRYRMMSIGLHPRIVGRPGRCMGLRKFVNYVSSFNDVWICKREEIAQHWYNPESVAKGH